jgi:CHAT domain-containing protein/Flp pilus assembly protein TadD
VVRAAAAEEREEVKIVFRKSFIWSCPMLSLASRAAFAVALFVLLLGFTTAHAQDAKPLVITGELTKKDPFDKVRKASHHKVHELELKAGEIYMIDLRSVDFDTFLRLEDATGKKISENDDISAVDLNSRLGFVPKKSGRYRAVVTTFNVRLTGRYTLQIGTLKKVGEPRVLAGKITEKSPKSKGGGSFEVHKVEFKAGELWLIELMSKDFAPVVYAISPQSKLIAFDDASGKGLSPRLVLDIGDTGEHSVGVLAPGAGTKGEYTLRLERLERTNPLELTQKERWQHEASKLTSRGVDLQRASQFRDALEPLSRAVEYYQKLYPKATHPHGHPNFAASLTKLASVYDSLGEYAKAELLYEQALEIYRQVSGENHPNFAATLGNLASLYQSQGAFAKAEPLSKKALEIYRQVLGEKHPDFATSLNNLAALYRSHGDYAKAEPLYQHALEIRGQVLGEKHPEFATSLNNLAVLYQSQGDYTKAEPLLKRTLEITRQALGDKHPDFAVRLNNLAFFFQSQGDYAKAEPLYKQALEIKRQVLGEKHPDFATSLNNLALLYQSQRDYAKAEPLHKQARDIYGLVLGEKHPDFAMSLNNLAGLYAAQGVHAKAEPLYKQALEIKRHALGEKHPDYARSLNNLAMLYTSQRAYTKAEPLAKEAVLIMRQHLEDSALAQSERQQIAHRAVSDFYWNNYLLSTTTLPATTTAAYDLALSWKGSVTVRQRLTRIARSATAKDPQAKEIFERLDQVSRLISTWTSMLANRQSKGIDLQKKLADLSAEREVVEAKLSARTEGFRKFKQSQKLTTAQLQKQLPEGTVLVDFFEYGDKLAAFVVTRDRIERIELKETKPIAEAVERFRKTLRRATPLTGKDDAALVLREKLLDPLDKHLAGARLLLIAPVGPLTSLPFAALPGKKEGKYLIEEIPIAILPVPQMLPELLAKRDPARADAPPSLLALGDVDFDGPLVALAKKTDEPEGWKRRRAGEAMNWNRLLGTRGEILAIEDVFRKAVPKGKLTVMRGSEPTEAAVRQFAPQHEYLHFATHGFFASKDVKSALRLEHPKRVLEADSLPRFIGHHPGLLSGIVLAGANRPKEDDDGVLTALEVSELDLTRVELAVLSACETGLGEVAGGEGVLGLQRAFQIAGARTTITSLWKVDDQATRKLMERFYDNYWKKNLGTLEALREAQLAMLHGDLARGLDLGQGPNDARLPPYYWAAFVLSGDWR